MPGTDFEICKYGKTVNSRCIDIAAPGRKFCKMHLRRGALANRRYRDRNKVQGRCCKCTEFAVPGHTRCEKHLEILRAYSLRHNTVQRKQRKERGVCPGCGASLHVEGNTIFRKCLHCLTFENVNYTGMLKELTDGVLRMVCPEELRTNPVW